MRNSEDCGSLLIVSSSGPGPSTMILLLITSSPVVSVIVWPLSAGVNPITSPSCASASAWRNEPGPLSFVLVTISVGVGVGEEEEDGVGEGEGVGVGAVSYTHLRAHETPEHLVCRLLLEKKKKKMTKSIKDTR